MSSEIKALYAGSFDPPTLGHECVIRKGFRAFPNFEIQVGFNPAKNYLFSAEERVALIEKIIAPIGDIAVSSLNEGFTIKYAYENRFTHMVKGIRNAIDLEYEENQDYASQLYLQKLIERDRKNGIIGDEEYPEIDPVSFPSPPHLKVVSSSFVRGLVKVKDWELIAPEFISPIVMESLEQKLRAS